VGVATIAGVVFALVIAPVDDYCWGCWGRGVGGDRGVCLTTCMMYTALGEAEDSEEARGGGAVLVCRGRDNSGCHGGICVCDTICTTIGSNYYYAIGEAAASLPLQPALVLRLLLPLLPLQFSSLKDLKSNKRFSRGGYQCAASASRDERRVGNMNSKRDNARGPF
jgi:hypothetical protein